MRIEKIDSISDELCEFIDNEFSIYASEYGVVCDYNDFCFVAKEGDSVVGGVAGHSYYNEVYISDLVVKSEYRGQDIGAMLIKKVEAEFTHTRFENINLTTYAFQALEFYKKMGFEVEYARKCKDEKLTKYFLIKYINIGDQGDYSGHQ